MMKDRGIFILGSSLLSVVLLGLILTAGFRLLTTEGIEFPEEVVPTLAPIKIEHGVKHPPYNTNPPTSGWYTESSLRDGIFTTPLPDEQLVEALTKGIVVVNYNCQYKSQLPSPPPKPLPSDSIENSSLESSPSSSSREPGRQTPEEIQAILQQIKQQNKICGDLISGLRKIVEKKGVSGIILAPNPKLDNRLALASWGRLDKFLWIDEKKIENFIDTYRGKKPKL